MDPKIAIDIRAPAQFSAEQIQQFKDWVLAGEEVDPATLDQLVEQALVLAFLHVDDQVAGIGAIKRPFAGYRAKVFAKAKLAAPEAYAFEVGWIFVLPGFRGQKRSKDIVERLAKDLGTHAAYATSHQCNHTIHEGLREAGFMAAGQPYPSKEHPERLLQVFLKAASA